MVYRVLMCSIRVYTNSVPTFYVQFAGTSDVQYEGKRRHCGTHHSFYLCWNHNSGKPTRW